MRGNALLACTEYGVDAVEPIACSASRSRIALITRWKRRIIEIVAARPLHEVAADARHIAQLRRSSCEKGLGKHWITLPDKGVICRIAVTHHGAYAYAPFGQLEHFRER